VVQLVKKLLVSFCDTCGWLHYLLHQTLDWPHKMLQTCPLSYFNTFNTAPYPPTNVPVSYFNTHYLVIFTPVSTWRLLQAVTLLFQKRAAPAAGCELRYATLCFTSSSSTSAAERAV